MTDIADLLAAPGLEATAFPVSSRYHGIGIAALSLPDGTVRAYLKRRFVPQTGDLQAIGAHRVAPGERADLIAAAELGDATQMWRLSDANGLGAEALVGRPGVVLVIAIDRPGGKEASGA